MESTRDKWERGGGILLERGTAGDSLRQWLSPRWVLGCVSLKAWYRGPRFWFQGHGDRCLEFGIRKSGTLRWAELWEVLLTSLPASCPFLDLPPKCECVVLLPSGKDICGPPLCLLIKVWALFPLVFRAPHVLLHLVSSLPLFSAAHAIRNTPRFSVDWLVPTDCSSLVPFSTGPAPIQPSKPQWNVLSSGKPSLMLPQQ